jgi:hypothetical protein
MIGMAESGNQVGNSLWPSLEAASRIFDLSSFALIGGLVVGAIATVLIVWMGIVKEQHWDVLREHSNEKVASLELETAKANVEVGKAQVEIAKAHEGIADANARAAQAEARALELQLALEKLRAPRLLSVEQRSRISDKLRRYVGLRFDTAAPQSAEALSLLIQIEDTLSAAGWTQVAWVGGALAHQRPGRVDSGIVGASGVVVQFDAKRALSFSDPAGALVTALEAEGIPASKEMVLASTSSTDAIHIAVGVKQ